MLASRTERGGQDDGLNVPGRSQQLRRDAAVQLRRRRRKIRPPGVKVQVHAHNQSVRCRRNAATDTYVPMHGGQSAHGVLVRATRCDEAASPPYHHELAYKAVRTGSLACMHVSRRLRSCQLARMYWW